MSTHTPTKTISKAQSTFDFAAYTTKLQRSGKLPSVLSYLKHGLSRSVIQRILVEEDSVHPAFQDALEKYYLLFWSPEYLLAQLESTGMVYVPHSDTTYIPIWHSSFTAVRDSNQVSLSFRKPISNLQLPAYVIIKVRNGN